MSASRSLFLTWRSGTAAGLLLAAALAGGCVEVTRVPPDHDVAQDHDRPVDCGAIAGWDGDGDGISDAIERNNADEGYLPFDLEACDENPSAPVGSWYGGELTGGVNLTDRGAGYVHNRGGDPVDGDDWGTLALVTCIEAVGRAWESSGLRVNVNDLSQRPGGLFEPHRSHQNGLDVDVRYVRRDGRDHPLDLRYHPQDYDPLATQELFRLFLHHCEVERIFADLDRLGFPVAAVDPTTSLLHAAPGHSNHFHVRLKSPGGAP